MLDIIQESYGFSADLIETILTNEYQCGRACFSKDNYKLHCYV